MSPEQRSLHPIQERLRGGERRSIGKSNEVAAMVLKEPVLFDVLFYGLLVDDPVVRMRSADAAEKVIPSAQPRISSQVHRPHLSNLTSHVV
jgi:hypothetical protein